MQNSIIPNDVKSIANYAFTGIGLTAVVIPNSVTSIGSYAFYNTKLRSVNIPSGVKSIWPYAFAATSIVTATFEDTSGWKTDLTTLSSDDLSNTSTAATYLKSTYSTVDWQHS